MILHRPPWHVSTVVLLVAAAAVFVLAYLTRHVTGYFAPIAPIAAAMVLLTALFITRAPR